MEYKIKPSAVRVRALTTDLIGGLLVLLFIYTAFSKLLDLPKFEGQMYAQALPRPLATLLVWTLPPVEIVAGVLLIFQRTKSIGLWTCAILMALFTIYAGMVLAGAFDQVPCACGGAIAGLGWRWHFIFNLFFMLLSFMGIYLNNRERSVLG